MGALAGIAALLLPAIPAQASERSTADRQLLSSIRDLTEPIGGPPLAIAVVQRGAERRVYRSGVAELAGDRSARRSPEDADREHRESDQRRRRALSRRRGKLSLGDRRRPAPDPPVAWHAVTLRAALNHTGGLPDFSSARVPGRCRPRPSNASAAIALLGFVAGDPLDFPPGTDYDYSNSDNVASA